MRKVIFVLLTLILTSSSYSTTIRSFTNPKAEEVLIQIPGTKIQMTLTDFVRLKPSDLR
jgi:type III secretory pathway component EscS